MGRLFFALFVALISCTSCIGPMKVVSDKKLAIDSDASLTHVVLNGETMLVLAGEALFEVSLNTMEVTRSCPIVNAIRALIVYNGHVYVTSYSNQTASKPVFQGFQVHYYVQRVDLKSFKITGEIDLGEHVHPASMPYIVRGNMATFSNASHVVSLNLDTMQIVSTGDYFPPGFEMPNFAGIAYGPKGYLYLVHDAYSPQGAAIPARVFLLDPKTLRLVHSFNLPQSFNRTGLMNLIGTEEELYMSGARYNVYNADNFVSLTIDSKMGPGVESSCALPRTAGRFVLTINPLPPKDGYIYAPTAPYGTAAIARIALTGAHSPSFESALSLGDGIMGMSFDVTPKNDYLYVVAWRQGIELRAYKVATNQ
eukprot:NODE_3195_length_1261_cov_42.999121_g3032_i0.p1 GENE.NODE_3195_length_1261_cov_42.999121_g3032_i0~~NODE_3195_length_1261_cov_42.999121_g3032_i0.p1  ORF type:complete len:384 (+),score=76.60 NODE_3195_length_1261_cov_42.999121_g3032_i0:52-1152(+)